MTRHKAQAQRFAHRLLETRNTAQIQDQLQPDHATLPPRVQNSSRTDHASVMQRWNLINKPDAAAILTGQATSQLSSYDRHIENLLGEIRVPIGLAGPLRVNGLFAKGDFYIPMATTEAALVASYNRGCQAVSRAGGASSIILAEGVSRSPGFVFARAADAGQFAIWVMEQQQQLVDVAATTTRHGRLEDISFTVEGNHLYLHLHYFTGDAAGQNMVTLATQAVCDYVVQAAPIKPLRHFVEANMSGDKKASMLSFMGVRGKKVCAEIVLAPEIVTSVLRTSPGNMAEYALLSAFGGVMSGTIGVQGHYANGLAALFLATGQDVACISEASVGVTRMNVSENGGLYASVTLPNLIVGTVGGGTNLPSQAACLDIMNLRGNGKAGAFAEVCAALCLAGELSIIAALSAGHFANAHGKLARGANRKAAIKKHQQP